MTDNCGGSLPLPLKKEVLCVCTEDKQQETLWACLPNLGIKAAISGVCRNHWTLSLWILFGFVNFCPFITLVKGHNLCFLPESELKEGVATPFQWLSS